MSTFFVDNKADFQKRLDKVMRNSTYAPGHQLSLLAVDWRPHDEWVNVIGRTSGPVLDSNGSGRTITLVGGKDRTFKVDCPDKEIHDFVHDLWMDRAAHEVDEWHRVNGACHEDPHPERVKP